jgi:hypothetical protein
MLPLLGHLDADRIPLRDMVLLGSAVGAAFFVRRVVVVHFGVILLFLLYYRWQIKEKSVIDPASRGAVFGFSVGIILLIGYTIWSGGSVGTFVGLLNKHLVGLVLAPASAGNGAEVGTGIIGGLLSFIYRVVASNATYIFTYMRAVTSILPVLLLLLIYPVIFLRKRVGNRKTFGIFVVLGLSTVLSAFLIHFAFTESSRLIEASIVAAIVGLGIAIINFTPEFESDSNVHLWNQKLLLPAGLAVAIIVSYAVRDRKMFVTYWQDVFPYMAILAGVAGIWIWNRIKNKKVYKFAWASALVIAILISFSLATPLVVGPAPNYGATQFTTTDVVEIGSHLNDKFGDDAQGFSAQPIYILEANHRVTNDFSRKYWIIVGNQESRFSSRSEIINTTASKLSSGETCYILIEDRTENVLVGSINETLHENYHRAELSGEIRETYRKTNTELFVYYNTTSC